MDLTEKISEAKRRMPMPDLLRHYRLEDRAKKSARSPFRADSDSNAFGIFTKSNGDWNWKDFVTGEFGDEIDFIAKIEGRSNEDAIIKFLEISGVGVNGTETSHAPSKPLRRRFEAEGSPEPAAPFDWAKCVEAFAPKVAEVAEWRGLSVEFLESFREANLIGLHAGLVAFPVHDKSGAVVGCHAKAEGRGWRYFPAGTKCVPLVFGDITKAKSVFVFESQWDAMAVADRIGWDKDIHPVAFIATRSAGNGDSIKGLVPDGCDIVAWPQNDPPRGEKKTPAEKWMDDVCTVANRPVKKVETPKEHKDANDWTRAGVSTEELWKVIEGAKNPQSSMLLDREFDFDNPPKKTFPVLWLGDVGIAKPCDLVAISAQVKAGKSAMIGAIMACLASNNGDFLGLRGENPDGKTILHFDTEQSPEDHHDLILRTLKRGNLDRPPKFLRSFCFTDLSVKERNEAVAHALKSLSPSIAAVLIDGVADLCKDVNDPEESNALVDRLYKWAIEFHTPVICVLHENPGTTTGKTRGHLGSQLERKAATNLRLEKDASGKIEIFTEKARRGHIARGSGPCFQWSDEYSMHVSTQTKSDAKSEARNTERAKILHELACNVFSGMTSMQWTPLIEGLMEKEQKSKDTAKRRLDEMRKTGILNYFPTTQTYSINPLLNQ